jgi:DNA-binding MarR family transcriptional regulator
MANVKSSRSGTLYSEMGSRPAPGSMVLLTKLSRLVYRRATDAVLGMSLKRYLALTALREQPNISQQAFCEAVHLDPNNCVLLLNSLEADALVERRRDPTDRRRHIVILTRTGQKALEHADRALESVEDEVLCCLSDDDRATLHRLLLSAIQGAPAEANATAGA